MIDSNSANKRFDSSKGIKKFCLFADEVLPELQGKTYAEYLLQDEEWELLGVIQEVLKVFLIIYGSSSA